MSGRSFARRRGRAAVSSRLLAGALALVALPAAADAGDALSLAARDVQIVKADLQSLGALGAKRRAPRSTEQLIAAGDLSLRAKDYETAIDTFNQVVELYRQGKASANAHADGIFWLGEAYLESGQLLSARRQYADLLELANGAPYDFYAGRCLGRLIDVAQHTGRVDTLDALAERVERMRIVDPTGSFDYARAKLSFARGRLEEARRVATAVAPESEYSHQARYLLGAVLVKQALVAAGVGLSKEAQARLVVPDAGQRFAPAIAQFRDVAQLPRDTPAHRAVVDQAWLAIGRLNYEAESYLDAAQAYIQVEQGSPVYFEMLFELAWVYVRVGDYQRAERALELLSVAAPHTLDVADGALLRADLMLRSGRFERALEAYEQVRSRFEPARERVDKFLATTAAPELYYDRLIEEGLAIGGASALPELALDWVREEAREERVIALIDDVTHARDVLRRSRRLASKLNATLAAPSRAQAFPELKQAMEKVIGLSNQLCAVRRNVARGFDDADDASFSGQLGQVRRERRALMDKVAAMPVVPADFERREQQGERAWSELSQALQRATLETDRLQAVINGLRQVLEEGDKHGVTRERGSRTHFQAQVAANENALARYRTLIDTYRQQVENGRVQVGLGDQRYAEDEQLRQRFRALQSREVELLGAHQGGDDSFDYARAAAPVLAELAALERRLDEVMASLEAEVSTGADDLRRQVAEETERVETYTHLLDELDQSARLLVGEVAMKNFASVRDRLKSIVLRADVGIVQQAWELREEQQVRLRGMQRQRALEEQNLEDELREVSDDVGEGP